MSCVWLFATAWTEAHKAPPTMEFSRQEFWSELPFPSAGDLPYPGTEPGSWVLQADSLPAETPGKIKEAKTIPQRKISIQDFQIRQLMLVGKNYLSYWQRITDFQDHEGRWIPSFYVDTFYEMINPPPGYH